ncbi:MAG: molybdopterin biosynthesis protein [Nitrospirae bacterium]|nr:molybdopterin biosynthesis protein [Nitrospirota bacterium]
MRRNIFREIQAMPLDEALALWFGNNEVKSICLEPETVPVIESLFRVTGEAVTAKLSSPSFHSSAMDGYAVRFSDTFSASETSPKRLKIGSEAIYIDTGQPMPDEFNAVVMVEDTNIINDSIEIISPVTPWQNVRTIGEDIVSTELILPENHRIRPIDVGAMLASGHTEVKVRKKPVVALLPTGSEIIEPGTPFKKGNIIEFNSRILGGLVTEWGGKPLRLNIVPDEPHKLKSAIKDATEKADLIVIIGGASAGSKDFTSDVIRGMGEVISHGISIKPGKPLILGIINGKPVLGIPGYPVSAYITFLLFAMPLIKRWQGLSPEAEETISSKLSRQIASPQGQEEFIRVKLGKVRDCLIATPIGRGAGLVMSLVRADGFLRIPQMSEGFPSGADVNVTLLRSKKDIENTIVSIGSHDNTLDILANVLKKRYPELSFSSAHVGSMAGLISLKRAEAHIAPTHLLDEETGQYNVPFIKRLMPEKKIVLINLVYRIQGLVVKKGNPKDIKGFRDLKRDDVIFINRQRGAGTRLLLDKNLRELGIEPRSVKGYEREEYTHMAVASAILTGLVDTGLAILASANALGLDFIPLVEERYDFAILEEFIGTEKIQALLKIIREDKEFRESVLGLGGYDIRDMGNVMWSG